ncbi:pilus assembly PilX N-terminal domain-containing protein [Acidobacteria bacterium AH-259-D05]|nr:pilus assembly PilX N-terminal domain-containing protein [Acidobacteria bacterium AH-259-D05]
MKNEQGIVLLIVMIISVLLMLLGMSMTFTSMTDFSMGNELENKKRALTIAEAGFNTLKESLRGNDLSTYLAATTVVPKYINYSEPTPGTDAFTYFSRNPLAPLEAMNVDFDNLPTQIGTRNVNGLLTPAGGTTLGTGGRYWAKLTDNDDGDSDLTVDADGKVYLRVMGIQKIGGGQVSTYGGTSKNSLAILEATLKRDTTFDLSAPFTFYGPDIAPASGSGLFDGAAFTIDGYDHPTMTLADLTGGGSHTHDTSGTSVGLAAVNAGGATTMTDTLNANLAPNQQTNVTGAGGTPSLEDATNSILSESDEDAANIFDANYVMNLVEKVKGFADTIIPAGTNYSSNIGSDADPQITFAEGDLTFSESGAGLLVVKGRLDLKSGFAYRGLILVVGTGELDTVGPVDLLGGFFIGKMIGPDVNGDYTYDIPQISISGVSKFYYQGSGMELGYELLPIKLKSWREIAPEFEPTF